MDMGLLAVRNRQTERKVEFEFVLVIFTPFFINPKGRRKDHLTSPNTILNVLSTRGILSPKPTVAKEMKLE